jgi:hypothetical protein
MKQVSKAISTSLARSAGVFRFLVWALVVSGVTAGICPAAEVTH